MWIFLLFEPKKIFFIILQNENISKLFLLLATVCYTITTSKCARVSTYTLLY